MTRLGKVSVLVLDADPAIRRLLSVLLEPEKWKPIFAGTAAEGLSLASSHPPDALIVDPELPDSPALRTIAALREWNGAPLLVISEVSDVAAKIAALDAGAKDYLVKPFDGRELLARLRAMLRQDGFAPDACLDDGFLRINLATREAAVNGQPLLLTATEEAVFYVLARHVGAIVPSETIARAVWGSEAGEKRRAVQVYIERLRRSLQEHGAAGLIQSVGSIGYRLVPHL